MLKNRIAVIGGGPGGLMTAYLLQKRCATPCHITIFEAGPRLGGKVTTRVFESAPVQYEAGAAELYDYSAIGPDPLRELIAELGLTTSPMGGETVVMDGHFLQNDDDIQRAFGPATVRELRRFLQYARRNISPAEYYESDWKQDNLDPLMPRSFRSLLSRIPDEAARRYVQVAVHSDLATEPHETNAAYGLQNYLMNDPAYMRLYTIDGGLERLPRELAKRLTAKVHLRRPVVRVENVDNIYRVTSRDGDKLISSEFDFVVAALPNNWLPSIDWAGPTLQRAMHKHHKYYDRPAHYLRVSVLFKEPFWRDHVAGSYFMLDAFGGCCVYDETSRQPGATHGVLAWLLAGDAAVNLGNSDDRALVDEVLASLPAELHHGRDLVVESRVHRWIGAVNGLPGGMPSVDPELRHRPARVEHPRFFVVGDYLFDSTLNGVLDSADYVVESIVEDLTSANVRASFAAQPSAIVDAIVPSAIS